MAVKFSIAMLMAGLGLAATAGTAADKPQLGENTWPFITIRQTRVLKDAEAFKQEIAINARHPGSADEYWLYEGFGSGANFGKVREDMMALAAFRPLMEAAGIAVGSQQGVTIGHGPSGLYKLTADGKAPADREQLPADAYELDRNGQRIAYLCPRSPAAWAHEARLVELIASTLNPVSIWLDDDMRMSGWREEGCYCDRCIKDFNAAYGYSVTREELVRRFEDAKRAKDPIRRDWRRFRGESLALFARAAREGADRVNPKLRLALQTVNGLYNDCAESYLPTLKALAGNNGLKAGIRTGGGNYMESLEKCFVKSLDCACEAERCRDADWVAQISYEMEIYTREVLHKSAEAIMIESAIALAAGCDALTEYWWDPARAEPLSYYEEFATMIAAWRPYFEKVASYSRTTSLGGLARFRGADANQLKDGWYRDADDLDLARYGVAVTVFDSKVANYYVNAHTLREWGEGDAERIAKAGAVVDAAVWERFLNLGGDVVRSAANAGRMVKFDFQLMKKRNGATLPSHDERQQFLNALDKVALTPVRIDRAHPLFVYPRINAAGKTIAVTIVNGSIGRCLPTTVKIRRPAGQKATWWRPEVAPVALTAKSGAGDELIVKIPVLPGMQPATITLD